MTEAIATREGAREWIARIRSGHGSLSREDEDVLRRDHPKACEALQSVRRNLASATKTLATNLYSKDTRFLYELIQNAEDNQYTRAEASSQDPFISFSLYPGQLVIDCNEDGFTAENVKALSSVGKSTKAVAQGYIGKKGIGFKSVFKIAHHVHVQSGLFSFGFQCTRDSDDESLGMITPLDEPYENLPEDVCTRITLDLQSDVDFSACAKELSDIPDTLLLFLGKLRSLQINVYPADGDATETVYSRHRDPNKDLKAVKKQLRCNQGEWVVIQTYFRVARKTIKGLPCDGTEKQLSRAEVVLAFPVNKTGEEAVLRKQHVFAYLPLRAVGFKFLVQSDFSTQASREDVLHSPRNDALLSGVAQTFRDAVREFCKHGNLQYQWMGYLPDDSVSDEFWRALKPKIEALLKCTPVLRSWSGRLYRPDRLRYVPLNARDQYGEPLFEDLSGEIYLAPLYTPKNCQLLKPLGTHTLSMGEFLDRLQADLQRSNSKMKKTTSDDDWHSRVAILLRESLELGFTCARSLPLIPLADKSWVAADGISSALPIYFPTSGLGKIPKDLGLSLVNPNAVKNRFRERLFADFGVTECDPSIVISAIYQKHAEGTTVDLPTTPDNHLQFLFFSLPAGTGLDKTFYLSTEGGTPVDLSTERSYFPGYQCRYNAQGIFQPASGERYPAKFIRPNPDWLKLGPTESRSDGTSFNVWLETAVGVKRIPQIHESNGQPSGELNYILDHRSGLLLGLLKEHWSHYAAVMSDAIEERIRKSNVLSHSGAKARLQGSYLPLPKLKAQAESCGVREACFFVHAPWDLKDEDEEEWKFLSRFGVQITDDANFYLKLLDCIATSIDGGYTAESKKAIFRVYNSIMEKCITEEDFKNVQSHFMLSNRIYLPSQKLFQTRWVSSGDCVWYGPDWLSVKSRLSSISEYRDLKHFFKNILAMRDATFDDSLDELSSMQKSTNLEQDHPKALQIYHSLYQNFGKQRSHKCLWTKFENSRLIFVPSRKAWFPPSACVWLDDETPVREWIPIGTPYAPLEYFFTRMLKVKKPDFQMSTQGLKPLPTEQTPSLSQIEESIRKFSLGPNAADSNTNSSPYIFSSPTDLPLISSASLMAHPDPLKGAIQKLASARPESTFTCFAMLAQTKSRCKAAYTLPAAEIHATVDLIQHATSPYSARQAFAISRLLLCHEHYQQTEYTSSLVTDIVEAYSPTAGVDTPQPRVDPARATRPDRHDSLASNLSPRPPPPPIVFGASDKRIQNAKFEVFSGIATRMSDQQR